LRVDLQSHLQGVFGLLFFQSEFIFSSAIQINIQTKTMIVDQKNNNMIVQNIDV